MVAEMREIVAALGLGYLALALVTRAMEAVGLLTRDCYSDCWCRRPGLSMLRWVLPRSHHDSRAEEEEADQLDILSLA